MSATQRYREARDLLISLTGRHEEALEQFAWPDVGERFNWGVDWFDAIARGNDDPALVVVGEDGSSEEISFDAMAARSDRVGRWLSGLGVGRGDPVLLMLGNQVELWDVMLAVMKLGAVIVPTATAAGAADLADRVVRSRARAVVTTPDQTGKFAELDGGLVRISVGPAEGWADLRDAYAVDVEPLPHPGTAPGDPLLLYFTSGTTARPKLVEHTQVSYPVGHLSTAYWLGLQPGDRQLYLCSPGWALHAWSCFFGPWIAESSFVVLS
jgi:acetyl-CoA synthetase